jgi:hypothetical protein
MAVRSNSAIDRPATRSCCPDLPPSRAGIALALPRYRAELGWEGRHWNQTATEHLQLPCPACRAAGWRRPLNENKPLPNSDRFYAQTIASPKTNTAAASW